MKKNEKLLKKVLAKQEQANPKQEKRPRPVSCTLLPLVIELADDMLLHQELGLQPRDLHASDFN